METKGPGDAEKLATRAIEQGYSTVIAAGGDGTVYEVLNGLVAAKANPDEIRLGVLPLGTVNVFAKELGMPMNAMQCREVLLRGNSCLVDLPITFFTREGSQQQRAFAQLGGAGLDALAIQEVSFKIKKRLGPLAYIIAGLKVLGRNLPCIHCHTPDGEKASGKLILIGNGAYYGGRFRVFPDAALDDGCLHALVFREVKWLELPRRGLGLWFDRLHTQPGVTYIKAKSLKLESADHVPFELEGEVVGQLPTEFKISSDKLQVIVP